MSLDALRAGLAAPRQRRRRGPLVAAGGVVLVIAVAATVWARTTTPGVVPAARTARRSRPQSAPSTTSTTAAFVRVWPTTTLPPLVVQHAGTSFAVGSEGDQTAVGAFRCGEPLLALLRGDDVFVFAAWAGAGVDAIGAPVGHVDGARGLRAEPSGDGCDALVVDRTEEAPVRLNP